MLEANIPRIRAQRTLEDYDNGKIEWISPDRLYDLAMVATGDEALANSYRVNRIRADTKPATGAG